MSTLIRCPECDGKGGLHEQGCAKDARHPPMTPISDDMVELPRPLCTYADHSYPAFSKAQMVAYGQACAAAALEGSVAVPAWQDISTAPKDGKACLIWVPSNLCVYCAAWDHGAPKPGWFVFGGGWRDQIQYATHWQPLPANPSVTRHERGEGS